MMTTNEEIGMTFAIAIGISTYQSCSIVAALAEKGLIDPMKVAAWAETFAGGLGFNLAAHVAEPISEQLRNFADLIKAMATKPELSGRG